MTKAIKKPQQPNKNKPKPSKNVSLFDVIESQLASASAGPSKGLPKSLTPAAHQLERPKDAIGPSSAGQTGKSDVKTVAEGPAAGKTVPKKTGQKSNFVVRPTLAVSAFLDSVSSNKRKPTNVIVFSGVGRSAEYRQASRVPEGDTTAEKSGRLSRGFASYTYLTWSLCW
jgi:hypothetical protein